ncbi:hypothetical protein [Weissella cibaria]|nr:hypothetical protein [Weissella cibaria]
MRLNYHARKRLASPPFANYLSILQLITVLSGDYGILSDGR